MPQSPATLILWFTDGVHIAESAMKAFARQLAFPSGTSGLFITRVLNVANRPLIAGSVDALDVVPGARVADIGVGGGYGLQCLLDRVGPDGIVYGVDISPTAVAQAQRRFRSALDAGRLQLAETPMSALPFAAGSLDGAVTVNTVYYIADEELRTSLAEIGRALTPTGRLVVGVAEPDYVAKLPFRSGMRNRPLADLVNLIENSGLRIADHRRVGTSKFAFHVYVATPRDPQSSVPESVDDAG